MLTQEDFHGAFHKLLERYNKCIAAGREFHMCTINKSAHTKKVWKLIVCTSYILGCTFDTLWCTYQDLQQIELTNNGLIM